MGEEWKDDVHGIVMIDADDGSLIHFHVQPDIEVEIDDDDDWSWEYQD